MKDEGKSGLRDKYVRGPTSEESRQVRDSVAPKQIINILEAAEPAESSANPRES